VIVKPRAQPASSALLPARLRPHLAQLTSFVIVFAIGYSLGLLSSSIRPSPKPSHTTAIIRPRAADVPESANGTGTAAVTTSYPQSPPHDLFRFMEECGELIPSDAVLPTLLDKLLDGESPYASFPPPHVASQLHPAAARPRGWGSTGAVLAELVEAVRPDTVVEITCTYGDGFQVCIREQKLFFYETLLSMVCFFLLLHDLSKRRLRFAAG
jgi:hypothetical protein